MLVPNIHTVLLITKYVSLIRIAKRYNIKNLNTYKYKLKLVNSDLIIVNEINVRYGPKKYHVETLNTISAFCSMDRVHNI